VSERQSAEICRRSALGRPPLAEDAARYALNAWKSVPLGRFSAATSFELGPISPFLTPIDFSAGFSEKSARVFSQLPRD
jgi:hypothetical protein